MTTVGFLGLGLMGGPMATRLLGAGHDLVVWNRTPQRAADLVAKGARQAATPAEAASGASVVITMLADPAALEVVTGGGDGALAGMGADATLVEMSTVGPDAVRQLVERLPAGAGLIDAPVLGSVPQATDGALQIFVGGEAERYQHVRPVLEAMGTTRHVGPLGSGAAMKLVVNSTLVPMLAVLGEALALADGLGLGQAATLDVLESSPIGTAAMARRPSLESGDFPVRFKLALAAKDLDLVAAAAEQVDVHLKVAPAARAWVADAIDAGRGEQDYSSVLAHIRAGPITA